MILIPVLAMGYMLFSNTPDIKSLAMAYSAGVFTASVTGIVGCAKHIPFKFVFKTKNFLKFISNSFTTYSGNAVYNCLFPVVLNNFLVNFPNGIISCFYYSKNGIEAVNMITTDYSNRNITSELSEMLARKRTKEIRQTAKKK